MKIYDSILEGYQAREIAEQEGLCEQEAAKRWFEETFEDDRFQEQTIKYYTYVCEIPYIYCTLLYDFGADYYFCVKH